MTLSSKAWHRACGDEDSVVAVGDVERTERRRVSIRPACTTDVSARHQQRAAPHVALRLPCVSRPVHPANWGKRLSGPGHFSSAQQSGVRHRVGSRGVSMVGGGWHRHLRSAQLPHAEYFEALLLRVHGMAVPSVVDFSVMPRVIGGNLDAPDRMIVAPQLEPFEARFAFLEDEIRICVVPLARSTGDRYPFAARTVESGAGPCDTGGEGKWTR